MNEPVIPHRAFWNPKGIIPPAPTSRQREHQRQHIRRCLEAHADLELVRRIEQGRKGR